MMVGPVSASQRFIASVVTDWYGIQTNFARHCLEKTDGHTPAHARLHRYRPMSQRLISRHRMAKIIEPKRVLDRWGTVCTGQHGTLIDTCDCHMQALLHKFERKQICASTLWATQKAVSQRIDWTAKALRDVREGE
jgi:hypothetical protein